MLLYSNVPIVYQSKYSNVPIVYQARAFLGKRTRSYIYENKLLKMIEIIAYIN